MDPNKSPTCPPSSPSGSPTSFLEASLERLLALEKSEPGKVVSQHTEKLKNMLMKKINSSPERTLPTSNFTASNTSVEKEVAQTASFLLDRVETMSLLAPPAPTNRVEVVITPPRAKNTTPRLSDCAVVVNDILQSPSPVCRRTRQQLQARLLPKPPGLFSSPCPKPARSKKTPPAILTSTPTPQADEETMPPSATPSLGCDDRDENSESGPVMPLATPVQLAAPAPLPIVIEHPTNGMLNAAPVLSPPIMKDASVSLSNSSPTSCSDVALDNKINECINNIASLNVLSLSPPPSTIEIIKSLKVTSSNVVLSASPAKHQCHFCDFRAFKKSGLRFHLKNKHGVWKSPSGSSPPASAPSPDVGLPESSSKILTTSQLRTLAELKAEPASPVPNIQVSGEITSTPLEKQLELTPSPELTAAPVVDCFSPSPDRVLYYPDSLRCRFCELVLSSPRSYFDHVRELQHYEASAAPPAPPKPATPTSKEIRPPSSVKSVSNSSPADFNCSSCDVSFRSEALLLQHQCQKTKSKGMVLLPPSPGPIRNCNLCSYVVRGTATIEHHMRFKHTCKLCHFIEKPLRKLGVHLIEAHTCKVCSWVENSTTSLKDHVRASHSCPLCPFVERKRNGLRYHHKTKHGQWRSSVPSAVRNLSSALATSVPAAPAPSSTCLATRPPAAHQPPAPGPVSPLTPFKCSTCKSAFPNYEVWATHAPACKRYSEVVEAVASGSLSQLQRPSQPSNVFRCYCSFVASNRKQLDEHLAMHLSSRAATCTPPVSEDLYAAPVRPPPPPGFGTPVSNDPPPVSPPVQSYAAAARSPPSVDSPPVRNPSTPAATTPSSAATPAPASIPQSNCRIGNSLNLLFPMPASLSCPERGCTKSFVNKEWTAAKFGLRRHIERDHKIRTMATYFWCSICHNRIARNPKSHACLHGQAIIPLSSPLQWRCTVENCPSSFPSEAGLLNHTRKHQREETLAKGHKFKINKPPPRARRTPKLPDPTPTDTDEAITCPSQAIAPPASAPDILTPPNSGEEEEDSLLSPYIKELNELCSQDPSDGLFQFLCTLYDNAIEDISSALLPPPRAAIPSASPPAPFDTHDARSVQRLYKKNRPRAIRELNKKSGERCALPPEQLELYFTEAWSSSHVVSNFYPTDTSGRADVLESPFSLGEIINKLKSAENTAAGPDRLCYNDWRCLPRAGQFLLALFNACLHLRRVPPAWKTSNTILLPKKGDPTLPSNWRPICLSSTAYKLFTKCLTARLSSWCERYDVLSHCQKGFTPFDGILEHNFILQQALEAARLKKKDICIAWLDVTNAFGALPHSAIFEALTAAGTGHLFVDILKDLYQDATSAILSGNGSTAPIPILSGVKQGCPISGLMFNICIDPVIRTIQGSADNHQVLAFADDICLLAHSPSELQQMPNTTHNKFQQLGLSLNPRKSHSFHYCGTKPYGIRATSFQICGEELHQVHEGNFVKFLGKPVGLNICPDYKSFEEQSDLAAYDLGSKLSPWQIIDAMKSFVYPSFQFAMRTAQFAKEKWAMMDSMIKEEMKTILSLPERASNEYIFGHRKKGCVGLPLCAEDSDIFRIDS